MGRRRCSCITILSLHQRKTSWRFGLRSTDVLEKSEQQLPQARSRYLRSLLLLLQNCLQRWDVLLRLQKAQNKSRPRDPIHVTFTVVHQAVVSSPELHKPNQVPGLAATITKTAKHGVERLLALAGLGTDQKKVSMKSWRSRFQMDRKLAGRMGEQTGSIHSQQVCGMGC